MSRQKATKVEADRVVVLRFSLTTGDGDVVDEASEDEPFVYLHGRGFLIPKLEEALDGREIGERFEVRLSGDDAFGRPLPDAERVIPRDVLPADAPVAPGFQLSLRDDDEVRPAWVVREIGPHLVVSLSHPLAADALDFEAEVLKVRDASSEELERGFATAIDALSSR